MPQIIALHYCSVVSDSPLPAFIQVIISKKWDHVTAPPPFPPRLRLELVRR